MCRYIKLLQCTLCVLPSYLSFTPQETRRRERSKVPLHIIKNEKVQTYNEMSYLLQKSNSLLKSHHFLMISLHSRSLCLVCL